MREQTKDPRAGYVRRMFGRIAPTYDLVNRLMTAGQDRRWRSETVRRLDLSGSPRVLDVGAGTGDLCLEALAQRPAARLVAVDFTPEMIRRGRARAGGRPVGWVVGDAENLPFRAASFDAVVSGFLLRNASDLEQILAEQSRVARPGSRFACLETSPPQRSWWLPFVRFYLHVVVPTLGRLVAGESEAYRYLTRSTERFFSAESLAKSVRSAGFEQVGFVRKMLGSVAIHWGTKPGS
jgi:demethylmenaquinone methyltransferase / 2-methoxy-6-polyprenyl-1,4-benzoquinol methylase